MARQGAYIANSGNSANWAEGLSNSLNRLSQSYLTQGRNRETLAADRLFRQRQLDQGDARLALTADAQEYAQGAGQRAAAEEQRIFDLGKSRAKDAAVQRNSLISSVLNDPAHAYNMGRPTVDTLENAPGAFNPVAASDVGTPEHLDALLKNEDLVTGFEANMKANPQAFQDPKQIRLDVARLARESGDYSEAQIKEMQDTATEQFSTLSPDAQKQLHDEQKAILDASTKIFGNKASGNTTNFFGGGAPGYNVGSTSPQSTKEAFAWYADNLDVSQSKSGLKWLSEAVTPETFLGMFELNSPDISIDELKKVTAASQALSGVGPSHTLEAMRSLGLVRGDGTFDRDISDMMNDTDVMASITKLARQNQAAGASKKGVGGTGQTGANQARLNAILSRYNTSNNAIRAGGTQQKATMAQTLQRAKDYVEEQTGVASDFKLGGGKTEDDSQFIDTSSNTVTDQEEDALTQILSKSSAPAEKVSDTGDDALSAVSDAVSSAAKEETNRMRSSGVSLQELGMGSTWDEVETKVAAQLSNSTKGTGVPDVEFTPRRVSKARLNFLSENEPENISSDADEEKPTKTGSSSTLATKIFSGLNVSAKERIIAQAEDELASGNVTNKRRRLLVDILKIAEEQKK